MYIYINVYTYTPRKFNDSTLPHGSGKSKHASSKKTQPLCLLRLDFQAIHQLRLAAFLQQSECCKIRVQNTDPSLVSRMKIGH